MTSRHVLALLAVATAVVAAAPARPAPARVLLVTHSAGYEHDVVRRPAAGGPSTVERVIADLGRRSGRFTVTSVHTRDELARLTPASVRAHRVILFFTTGELPMAVEARQAIFESVRAGGGFVGVHGAADTWYTIPEYRELLGGTFDGHPWHQRVRIDVEDPAHPATRQLGRTLELSDEIYQFRSWTRADVHVLLRLDLHSVDPRRGHRADGDYALAWTKTFGRGRVIYEALGHEPALWADARFHDLLLGAIHWALGDA